MIHEDGDRILTDVQMRREVVRIERPIVGPTAGRAMPDSSAIDIEPIAGISSDFQSTLSRPID